MTEKVQHPIRYKNIKLLDDRIVLGTKEILTRDIEKFDVISNDGMVFFIFFVLITIAIAFEFITDFRNGTYNVIYIVLAVAWPVSISFGVPKDLSKKYLHIILKDGTIEIIHPLGFKSFVAQLQVVWENHDINKLQQLNDWANKEVESLNESLTESLLKDNKRKDLSNDYNWTEWNNQYILNTLKLRSIFNLK